MEPGNLIVCGLAVSDRASKAGRYASSDGRTLPPTPL